jgi:hypothetical protein
MTAPAIDGSATGQGSTSTTLVITLTTTQANDIIIVCFSSMQVGGYSSPATSVTASGLSFTRRKSYEFGANNGELEVWWALAASPLSSKAITVTYAGTVDSAGVAIGVSGADASNPWDANAALPALNNGASGSLPSMSGITTNNTEGLEIIFCHSGGRWWSDYTTPAGFTKIEKESNNIHPSHQILYKSFTGGALSGAGASYASPTETANWGMIGEALVASNGGGGGGGGGATKRGFPGIISRRFPVTANRHFPVT